MHKVRISDRGLVADELKRVYGAESREQAEERMATFCRKWSTKYPKLVSQFTGQTNLFSFFDFPAAIRTSLYTNNLAESLNKRLKRVVKAKEQFPSEDALERVVCTSYLEYNLKSEGRRHRGFSRVHYELLQLFE
jgi:transposase-like protein